jgi:hypothetical protein
MDLLPSAKFPKGISSWVPWSYKSVSPISSWHSYQVTVCSNWPVPTNLSKSYLGTVRLRESVFTVHSGNFSDSTWESMKCFYEFLGMLKPNSYTLQLADKV